MRLNNKKQYFISSKTIIEDDEGGKYEEYGPLKPFKANIYPASGKLQAEVYGERINYIMNMLIDGKYSVESKDGKMIYTFSNFSIAEGDGICVFNANTPDYKVISIKPYSHLLCEIEVIK